jgi:AraC family transcriptional activator FtrA
MIPAMRIVACLAYDRAPTFELSIAHEVFGAAELRNRVRLVTVAGEPAPLRTEHGWTIDARRAPVELGRGDVMVVAGWRDVAEEPPASVLRQVTRAAEAGATVVSLCTGAFVLGAAGVLDGRRGTTHWRYADELARRFPRIEVDPAPLYIDAGPILTSAGTVAGVDACLHLVRKLYGASVAGAIARHMVIAAHREGGQAQYLPQPVPKLDATGPDPARASMEWMSAHLAEPITTAELASRCHLSSRQYLRRFRAASGTTPYQWLLDQRIRRARELLESGDQTIEDIARCCGFGDAAALRSHFRRRVGTSPTQYRITFAGR